MIAARIAGRGKRFIAALGYGAFALMLASSAIAQDAGTSSTGGSTGGSSGSSTGGSSTGGSTGGSLPGSLPATLPPAIQSMLPPGVTAQQVMDAVKGASQQQQPNSPQPSTQILSAGAAPTSAASNLPSNLETIYSNRAGVPLSQYGYNLIANGGSVSAVLNGAIQDSYILGPGDQINLNLQGQLAASYSARVDRDGQVLFPNLPPIPASGRTFGEFRADLEAAVQRALIQTKAYVSIGEVRQLTVRVVGEVAVPGVYPLNGLSTVLDALNLAGGIRKSGSLRNITIVRGNRAYKIDLYSMLLTHGRTPDMTITQDDRIVVPPIGSTVAVSGDVRRPAIYELVPGSNAITAHELEMLSQGPEMRGVYRHMIQHIRPDGKEEMVDAGLSANALVHDGEILFVNKAVDVSLGKVSLTGSVRLPGDYALDRYRTVHDLLPSAEVLAPTPYMLLGLIEHTDPKTLQRVLIPFSPLHVIEGRENVNLASADVVHILTVSQMREFAAAQEQIQSNNPWSTGSNGQNGQPTQGGAMPGQTNAGGMQQNGAPQAGASITGQTAITGAASGSAAPAMGGTDTGGTATVGSSIEGFTSSDASFFGRVLADYRVVLTGGVHNPGVFLVSPGTTLDEVVTAAGGLDTNVDASAFEVTSTVIDNSTGLSSTHRRTYHTRPSEFSSVVLQPLDEITFHDVFTDRTNGRVEISGEVRYPGSYEILRGERLSEVLVRAGGLTSVAYPYGTVYLRKTIADQEKAGYQRIASEVQDQMMAAMSRGTNAASGVSVTPDVFAAMQVFVNQLKDQRGLGRMTVVADPSILAAHPERDPLLEPSDSIFIPQRPSTVTVLGEVMQPGTYITNPDNSVDDYVTLAGGYGQFAKEDMTFVVYPDGTAQRAEHSWLHFNHQGIPPGSVIFVPRDVFPVDWLSLTINIANILKDFAISAASVAVLSKAN